MDQETKEDFQKILEEAKHSVHGYHQLADQAPAMIAHLMKENDLLEKNLHGKRLKYEEVIKNIADGFHSLNEFHQSMKLQMEANSHKGSSWKNCEIVYLETQLDKNLFRMQITDDPKEYKRRCVNSANYLMMLFERKVDPDGKS